MKTRSIKILGCALIMIGLVMFLSNLSSSLWLEEKEISSTTEELQILPGMSLAEFGKANNIPNPTLKEIFGLTSPSDLEKKFDELGMTEEQVKSKLTRSTALKEEYESKNWLKIPLKFGLWFIFMSYMFIMIRKKKITPVNRKWYYLFSFTLFGVLLGSDPGPMGTVKDAIVLLGTTGAIFPPRLIAMSLLLGTVIIANKLICSWGCQVGTLQDALFRLNRNEIDNKGILKQYKPPFILTNTIRVGTFIFLILGTVLWGIDILEPIDPFKIFKPAALGITGFLFIVSLFFLSLFIYRPWCHFFCPFGLVGWFLEKTSIYKIKVNYEKCIACGACEEACPSTVMQAILRQEGKTVPDCFSCATCMNSCPVDAISFEKGKRQKPDSDKFKKLSSSQ